jgi:hypothetical protein
MGANSKHAHTLASSRARRIVKYKVDPLKRTANPVVAKPKQPKVRPIRRDVSNSPDPFGRPCQHNKGCSRVDGADCSEEDFLPAPSRRVL